MSTDFADAAVKLKRSSLEFLTLSGPHYFRNLNPYMHGGRFKLPPPLLWFFALFSKNLKAAHS